MADRKVFNIVIKMFYYWRGHIIYYSVKSLSRKQCENLWTDLQHYVPSQSLGVRCRSSSLLFSDSRQAECRWWRWERHVAQPRTNSDIYTEREHSGLGVAWQPMNGNRRAVRHVIADTHLPTRGKAARHGFGSCGRTTVRLPGQSIYECKPAGWRTTAHTHQ